MPRFLVESYVVRSDGAFDDACERARRTARTGSGLCYVDVTYVPHDETVMHLFDAPSMRALDEACRLAGLEFERIVEAVNITAMNDERGGRR
jgi:hypothetical protein